MIILKAVICILILIAVSACAGLIVPDRSENPFAGTVIPAGFFVILFLFEIVCVPVILFTHGNNFKYVCLIYTPLLLAVAAAGVYRGLRTGNLKKITGSVRSYIRSLDTEDKILWGIVLAVLICILYYMETRVIFDGDDAYYVSQSVAAWQNGTMYSTNPYNGRAAAIDMRHALAVFPMWIAYIGKMFGIHPTILCHTVLPVVFMPFALFISGNIGYCLLGDKKKMLPYFVLFAQIIILFGRVSIYTPETFLISRIWQGKAVAAGILIPVTLLAHILIYKRTISDGDETVYPWLFLLLVDAAAGVFSSLAVELVSILIGAGAVIAFICSRKPRILIRYALVCVPGVIYMILYLYFTYLSWR